MCKRFSFKSLQNFEHNPDYQDIKSMLMAGWRGIYCDTPCPAGRWGPECGLMCQCHNDGVCHHVTGENCLQYD